MTLAVTEAMVEWTPFETYSGVMMMGGPWAAATPETLTSQSRRPRAALGRARARPRPLRRGRAALVGAFAPR